MKIDEVLPLADGWKKVTYFGHELIVPDWVKWITVNSNGNTYGLGEKPTISGSFWFIAGRGVFDELPGFNITDFDWRETLREV